MSIKASTTFNERNGGRISPLLLIVLCRHSQFLQDYIRMENHD